MPASARVSRVSFFRRIVVRDQCARRRGLALWERLIAVGEAYITPYGTEAMHVLRAEKGYFIVGQETDGSVTPLDLGISIADKVFSAGARCCVPTPLGPINKQLVGILPEDPEIVLTEGAQLVADPQSSAMIGHVTSSYFGARIGRGFALALVAGGRSRHGEPAWAYHAGRRIAARIGPPVFYDPDGPRRDG